MLVPVTDLVILVPMLGRPYHVAPLVESIEATCDAHIMFMCSPDDTDVLAEVDRFDHLIVDGPHPGDYARKINIGFNATTEPLVFLGASDIRFHPGWFEAATAELAPGVGVVGTNDLVSPRVMRGEHATHSLVTRAYVDGFGTVDEPGKVLHEGYVHEFVDDELVCTAKHRGAWAFAANAAVEHLHPYFDNGEWDDTYRKMGDRIAQSAAHYKQRQTLWM